MKKQLQKKAKAEEHTRSLKAFQTKVDKAWHKLCHDIEHGASLDTIRQDRDQLTYLLGECDYLWHEYDRCYKKCQ